MLSELSLESVRDRVLVLRSLEVFGNLEVEALALLAEHARHRRFRAGDVLMSEGRAVEAIHIVVAGRVTVTRRGRHIASVGRSRGVGFISMLSNDPHGVDAVADVDTLTLEIPVDAVLDAYEENFSLLHTSLRMLSGSVLEKRGNLPASPQTREASDLAQLGPYPRRPLTVVERAIEMRTSRLFADCSLDAVMELARLSRRVQVDSEHVFWQISEPSSYWLRITYGRVYCTSAEGESVEVGRGFAVGTLDAVSARPRSFQARAVTKVVAHRYDAQPFLSVIEDHFDLALHMIRLLSRTLLDG